MTNDTDPLDELIQATRQRKRKSKPPPSASALNPLDLLTLPATQRQIVNYLSRKKRVQIEDIKNGLETLSSAEITRAIRTLKESGRIRAVLIDGKVYYRVIFGGTAGRGKIFLPEDSWSSLKLDNLTFLKQMNLFRKLPEHKLESLAKKAEVRHYRRHDVIVWQGESSDDAFLIKSGIVGVVHLLPGRKSTQLLAYLEQGDILGEIGLLEDQVRSATAIALSKVEILVIKRDQFLELLQQYDITAIELARMLGHRLVATSARLEQSEIGPHLVLVFRLGAGAGCTTIANSLAITLARETQQPTVYTEYPYSQQLPGRFGFGDDVELYRHPGGYDIRMPQVDPLRPEIVDTTLIEDQFFSRYVNIIIGLPDKIDDSVVYLLERADQVILIALLDDQAWIELKKFGASLEKYLHPEKTSILTVANRAGQDYQDGHAPEQADFDLPFLGALPPLSELGQAETPLPTPLVAIARAIAGRLGRTHEILIYIPATIDTDQDFEAQLYVTKTLTFLNKRFGGTVSSQAEGVWDSDEAEPISETVCVVHTFVTQAELNQYLNEVLDYVAALKAELQQETMALEIDQKLLLI